MFILPAATRSLAAASLIGLCALGSAATATAAPTTPTPAPSSATGTPTSGSTATPQNMQKLMGLLPKGYSATACTPVSLTGAKLATVDCSQNTDAGGPTAARFSLYPDPATMNADFQATLTDDALATCPGGEQSPFTWHYTRSPDQTAGSAACGTYRNIPEIVWTNNAHTVLAAAQGTDIASLYQWWIAEG
ncbi:hypothetical protein [Rhodococcus koreensis]|uniref:hypothetical protein n=1 Tax=Rhodococcus koreensis TaxID=99653 RepID=UPI0036DAA968